MIAQLDNPEMSKLSLRCSLCIHLLLREITQGRAGGVSSAELYTASPIHQSFSLKQIARADDLIFKFHKIKYINAASDRTILALSTQYTCINRKIHIIYTYIYTPYIYIYDIPLTIYHNYESVQIE